MLPSRVNTAPRTRAPCPSSRHSSRPEETLHSRTVLSWPHVTAFWPSEEKLTDNTRSVWPFNWITSPIGFGGWASVASPSRDSPRPTQSPRMEMVRARMTVPLRCLRRSADWYDDFQDRMITQRPGKYAVRIAGEGAAVTKSVQAKRKAGLL